MKQTLFRLALLLFVALLLFAPASPVSAFDSPLPGSNPADDITGGLDAIPAHLGVAPFVILIIEILKRTKLLKSSQATWAARALGGVLWLLSVTLPADVLADVTRIMAALAALGWSMIGSEKLYDFGRAILDTNSKNNPDGSVETV